MNNSREIYSAAREELRKAYIELNLKLQSTLLLKAKSEGFINSDQATKIFKDRILPLRRKIK